MVELLKLNNPIWIESPCGEGCFIHREVHDKLFPNQYQPCKSPTTRFESSKVCGVVPMNAIELIQNFLDPIKWMNMFPNIVTKARTMKVLDFRNVGGSIQLMYEKLHILSPLWKLGIVSLYIFKVMNLLRLESFLLVVQFEIWTMVKVTWIEHVQVDEKIQVHHTFRNFLIGCDTYGAKRWIITLQRMSERYNVEVGATCVY
ncbi:hypothetical protein H5410_021225 [Solanum commersonii]|uniref:START domain-containing protein n=1 Tax=Solanum commersonii TaxID=4109 RepID=A0A9J5ZDM5_SOLCO|nr:hypothetical protein H5410_021225 [Solanum commersonii]